jgi:hypothetical protein
MGMRHRLALLTLLFAAAGLLAAVAGAQVVQSGNVRVTFHAAFTPKSLPRERAAPITIEAGGKISTTDGSQPPPLREMKVELTNAGQIDTHGLPACRAAMLQSTSSAAALEQCGPARVGQGTFEARFDLTGKPILATGRAYVFNGKVRGSAGMLIHVFVPRPVRVSLVIPLRITHQGGRFGTVLSTHVPSLAGGTGSITELSLRIGRQFSYRGERHSYLSAACAAPPGFPGGTFTFARGVFTFPGDRAIRATLVTSCKVRKSAESG